MATLAPTPRFTRLTLASSSAGPFDVGLRLFQGETVVVHVGTVRRTDFTLSATFANGFADNGKITFAAPVPAGSVVTIDPVMTPSRSLDYIPSDPRLTANLNVELGRIWANLANLGREVNRALKTYGSTNPAAFPPPGVGGPVGWQGTELVVYPHITYAVSAGPGTRSASEFGLIPDGLTPNDAGFAAIRDWCTATGGTVVFDIPATYIVESQTVLSAGQRLSLRGGNPNDRPIIKLANDATLPIINTSHDTAFVDLENIIFDGNRDGTAARAHHTLRSGGCSRWRMVRCKVKNGPFYCLGFQGTGPQRHLGVWIEDCDFEASGSDLVDFKGLDNGTVHFVGVNRFVNGCIDHTDDVALDLCGHVIAETIVMYGAGRVAGVRWRQSGFHREAGWGSIEQIIAIGTGMTPLSVAYLDASENRSKRIGSIIGEDLDYLFRQEGPARGSYLGYVSGKGIFNAASPINFAGADMRIGSLKMRGVVGNQRHLDFDPSASGNVIERVDLAINPGSVVDGVRFQAGTTNNEILDGTILNGSVGDLGSGNRYPTLRVRGTTANRPPNPRMGETYYDTTLFKLLVYSGSVWTGFDGSAA